MNIFPGAFMRCCIVLLALNFSAGAQKPARFRALALYESGGHHVQYSAAARPWLNKLAADSNFLIDYITSTDALTDSLLAGYQLFIQLDYPPYAWTEKAVAAFEKYIEHGTGGWIGFHHATLLGEFDGYPIWKWFAAFMGGIKFSNYIPGFANGLVTVEDSLHPCMRGVPHSFIIDKEEWYTYDKSPRNEVNVLASVAESSYQPPSSTRMGDHPVIWSNRRYPSRNVYIFMGHSPQLFNNNVYTTIFRNAIFWAAEK